MEAEWDEIFEESVHKTILHRAGNLNLAVPNGYGRSGFLNLKECKRMDPKDYILILEKEELRVLFDRAVAYIKRFVNGGIDENLCL